MYHQNIVYILWVCSMYGRLGSSTVNMLPNKNRFISQILINKRYINIWLAVKADENIAGARTGTRTVIGQFNQSPKVNLNINLYTFNHICLSIEIAYSPLCNVSVCFLYNSKPCWALKWHIFMLLSEQAKVRKICFSSSTIIYLPFLF